MVDNFSAAEKENGGQFHDAKFKIDPRFFFYINGEEFGLAFIGSRQLFIDGRYDLAGAVPVLFKLHQRKTRAVDHFLSEICFGDHLIHTIFGLTYPVSQPACQKKNGAWQNRLKPLAVKDFKNFG